LDPQEPPTKIPETYTGAMTTCPAEQVRFCGVYDAEIAGVMYVE
jgi:hypothetical protein